MYLCVLHNKIQLFNKIKQESDEAESLNRKENKSKHVNYKCLLS